MTLSLIFFYEVKIMKKTIAMMLALAAISTTAFASPQTTFRPGEFEINAGMWDSAARTAGYKSD